ncbi:STAS domain-containing protein [Aggregatibacter actinomycetemcomitans]|uniref:STAS domain-containing protein n=1 Tax=Aggregatibacter actinomycetemcomitans TaxID=714 RepID=UPI00197B93F4|nr:lipid asymmetry maintenance protein MlaB [Aggregatibacter actinomycetemcomitans]MBN6064244.1 STAS domain-containing protein [Aggregatibacter actinomycetemcomitans]MBN6081690.1 STAS domain-containing protein [Aggregatibacter actinomycetemcomitans]MBN6084087.1 STAS domain-containing protein [Aggregatibacter actinomycetemcomitans]
MQPVQSLRWESDQNDDKMTLLLKGELSRNTLLPLWRQRASFLLAQKTETLDVHWDLSQVNRIDSAGFALLCDFLRHNQTLLTNERKQILQNPPSQLLTLADLFGLSDWITQFSKTDGNS